MKNKQENKPITIVGIGASAGGLEALKEFFMHTPIDGEVAYVVITHRNEKNYNPLKDILANLTPLPVQEINDQVQVKSNNVYLSSTYVAVDGDKLVEEKNPLKTDIELPIDSFFRSLAEHKKDHAIGVVLSGTGTDGTSGLHEIKGAGGMTMAQDLQSAQFAGMPGNAIAAGLVDYVALPGDMPKELLRYIHNQVKPATPEPSIKPETLIEIIALLRKQTGNDFSYYKNNTLSRRIERRMNVHHITKPEHYVRYLRENDHEVDLLFKELLIGVTSFFRDPAAYEILEEKVLPEILAHKGNGDNLRIWVTGCSTGQEAYSLAILVFEYIEKTGKQLNVQIFATDLDEHSINHARTGLYSEGIALDVTPERLKRFFSKEDAHYRVKRTIREMVVFATQNLIQDPPFTKLDLVSCRNLLIYLESHMQKKIMPLFHYSLLPGGILFLGSSETVGTFTELFVSVHSRWKIFQKKDAPLTPHRLSRLTEIRAGETAYYDMPEVSVKSKTANITDLAQKLLLNQHIAPSLIVNEKGDIYFIHGRTGAYLEPPQGSTQTTQNALDMAREGLQLSLTSIIRKAARQDGPVEHKNVRVKTNGHFSDVSMTAQKITEPEALRGLIWITFEAIEEKTSKKIAPAKVKTKKPENIENEQLEGELQFIKQNLQNTIEELEAANEEMKSTNEELQSTNEELQSANEELETAKEEMQSLNEELQTVNTELETKIEDLSYANDDMKNLLNSTGIATIFLDNDLNILRFTAQTKKIINLIQSDIGRPISDIVTQLEYTNLMKDAAEVLHNLVFKEIAVRTSDWSWYMMRIMPYRTSDNVINGLVITFVNITRIKITEILLAAHDTAINMILKKKPLRTTLEELARTIEEQSHGIWVSIGLYDAATTELNYGGAPSLPEKFNQALDNVKVNTDTPEPCGKAIFQKKHIIVPDIASAPQDSFTTLALKNNLKAAWAQPILAKSGEVIGSFTIYYQDTHQPSNIEEELISQTIPLVALAISETNKYIS